MIQTTRRHLSVYTAILAMIPKVFMAYQLWFWIGLVLNVISMAILVYFWRAIYANTSTISGLGQNQTINYILLAFIFMPLTSNDLIWEFGSNLREGTIIHHLLRPINFQGMNYAQMLGGLVTRLILQIPMAVVAVLVFGLYFPTELSTWLAFMISALLGFTVMFFFNWFLACFTFYTTEILGLGRVGGWDDLFPEWRAGSARDDAGMDTKYSVESPVCAGVGCTCWIANRHQTSERCATCLVHPNFLDPWHVDPFYTILSCRRA